jgi:hypothetical protein
LDFDHDLEDDGSIIIYKTKDEAIESAKRLCGDRGGWRVYEWAPCDPGADGMTTDKDREEAQNDTTLAGQYIDELFNAFNAQYGDVREKVLVVINKREARIRSEAAEEARECCAEILVACGISKALLVEAILSREDQLPHLIDEAARKERERCEDIVCTHWPDMDKIRAAILAPESEKEN